MKASISSGVDRTSAIIRKIRTIDPDIAIIATGGKSDESINLVIGRLMVILK